MQRRIFTHLILVCLVSWVCGNIVLAQSISIGTLDVTPPLCNGSAISIEVPFTPSGSFNTGNTFSVQLSNSSGSFVSGASIIGTGGATPINATIPAGTAAGSYKVRVLSSNPVAQSGESGTILTIIASPVAPVATSPVAFCGANTTALTATPLASHTLNWYDNLDAPSPSAPIPTVSGNYSVTQTNAAGCVSPKKIIAVTVSPVPAAPTITTPVALCQGATASALTATGETGATFNWYAAVTGSTTISSTPSTAAVGSISYFVSQTVNGCESTRAEIVVNVIASPAAPTVTSPISYCLNVTADPLVATGTDLLWYTGATGGTGVATAITPTTTPAGNKSYYVSQTVGACESPRAEIVVTTNETLAPTVASATLSYCKDEVAPILAANGTALKWYDVPTAGTAGTAPTPSTATVGSKDYYVSQTLNGCESARTKITVTVKAVPAAPTVAPVSLCEGSTATALTASSATSPKWYEALTGGTALSGAPVPATNVVGEKSYFVSQTVNGCEGPRSEQKVTTVASPIAPTVAPISYCINTTAVALTATGTTGTLKWYEQASGGVSTATKTPTTNVAGTKSYYVTQTVGSCESARAELVVTTNQTPAPTVASATLSYCKDEVVTALVATGTALKWYTLETGGVADATAPTPLTTTVGSKDYYVSQTLNGCESARTKITVTVKAVPLAPTVTALSLCEGVTASALTAVGTSLKWYENLTGGTALTETPAPTTDVVGNKSYFVSQTVNGCEGPRANLVVTTKASPVAPTVEDISYCINTTAVALTATGTTGTLKWYEQATGGSSTATKTPLTTAAGDKSYYVSQTVNGCESPRAELVVTTNLTPKPTVVAALSYCKGETVTALTATGTGLKWYRVLTGGTVLASAPIPQTDTVKTSNYYVSQTLNGCESERALIAVTVKALPAKPTVTDSTLNFCQDAELVPLTATGTALKWYTVATLGTGVTTAPTPLSTAPGTTSYYVSQTVNGCEGPRKKIDVTIKDTPVKPVVTTPVEYCIGVTAKQLTPSGAVYKWYTLATGGTGTATAPTPVTTTASTKPYYVSQTQTYSLSPGTLVCESERSKIDVVVNPLPSVVTVTDLVECQTKTDNNKTLVATGTTGNTILWYTLATGGDSTLTAPVVNLKNVVETTYYVTQKTAKNCESSTRVPLKVRVKKLPAAPAVTTPLVYCQFDGVPALKATFETSAVANWYGTASTGGSASTTAPTPSTANGGNTVYYVSQTLEGCEGDRSSISVTVNTTPKPTTTTLLSYCQDVVAPSLTATGNSLKWYRTATATEFQTTPFLPITPNVGDFYFYVTQTGAVNGCESPKEEILVKVKAKPSATISGDKSIELGQSADLKVDFTGNGPWTYKLSSGITGTTNNSPITIRVTPTTTTTYLVTEVSNECGSGLPVGSVRVTVLVPTISTGTVSTSNLCAGSTFSVPFQQSGYFVPENKFNVQISKDTVNTHFYTIPTTLSGNEATATVPDTTSGGSFYIRVVGENPGFKVVGSISPVTIAIRPLPSAALTGAKTIFAGETAQLRIDLKGDFPWTLNFKSGTKDSVITTSSTPILLNVKPAATTTYQVSSVFNQTCGNGKASEQVRIQVDPILGVEPVAGGPEWLKVYPNPVQSNSTLEIFGTLSPKDARWEVVDSNGKSVLGKKIKTTVTNINFSNLSEGLYFLRVENGGKSAVKKIIKVD